MIVLNDKEKNCVKDLSDQERLCIEKYTRCEGMAKDQVLCDLFGRIKKDEQEHLNSLNSLWSGNVPESDVNDNSGETYNPVASYKGNYVQSDKDSDNFLCTDCITTEKYVSSAYNFDLFQFADSKARKLLADIQVEEQNHAEMMYKYKSVNAML